MTRDFESKRESEDLGLTVVQVRRDDGGRLS
ncbi:hypothetical protein OIU84_026356 [Salix udensis]|uniref:Uncharacterized protein n=1 Tax=Salix udensis TaxID=889485 RepID=A0AAD6PEM1_9ROSI|nr:hypothetical protein OIU84_026356 [Salix udensis]